MKLSPFNWLALSFFGYFCAYGVFQPFFPVWLKSQNYGEELIGLVLASSYLFRFAGAMFFASRIKQASHLIPMLRKLAWASVVITAFIGIMAENFWWLFIAIGLFSMVNSAGMSLTDALATTWQRQVPLDYGKARLTGSLAFVIGVTVFGSLIGWLGDNKIIWILTALLGLYSVLQLFQPEPRPLSEESAVQKSISFMEILRNSVHFRLLLVAGLVQGSHAGYYVYSVIYWKQQGISVETTSLLWGLAVVAEILLFFFSQRLFKTWTVSQLFILATLGALVRWLGFSQAENLGVFALLQVLHCVTFATMHFAMVRYISAQSQAEMPKLQSLYNAFASCAGVAIMTSIAGVLFPISAEMMFYAMATAAGVALVLIPRQVSI